MKYSYLNKTDFPNSIGVYLIRFLNAANGKVYIGSTSKSRAKFACELGFRGRWRDHLGLLIKNKSGCIKLQHAFNKYGIENLVFEVVEVCDPENCIEREQFFIDQYDSCNYGYNTRPCASSPLGLKCSEETKIKISDTKKQTRASYYESIKDLYKNGHTTREIGKIVGLDPHTVGKILNENGETLKTKAEYFKKKIFQYDLEGNFIQSLESAYQAGPILGIHSERIRMVAIGKASKASGFYFSYEELTKEEAKSIIDENATESKRKRSESARKGMTPEARKKIGASSKGRIPKNRIKNINQLDKDGNLIKNWIDSKEIVIFYGLKNCAPVTRVLSGKRKYFMNCLWELADPK